MSREVGEKHERVLQLSREGKTTREISEILHISVATAADHIYREKIKMGKPVQHRVKPDKYDTKGYAMMRKAKALFMTHTLGSMVLVDVMSNKGKLISREICPIVSKNERNFTIRRSLPRDRSVEENFTWQDLARGKLVHVIKRA